MSAFPAPSYYFTGIGFNSAFYTVSTTVGLTQSQANALYLLKNTADTATALETFNLGISTNNLATTTATSNLLMYPNQTSGGIYLGVNTTATTGRTGVIHIGDGNSLPSGAGIHINNGTNVASNVNILNGTNSTGIINLGSSTSTTNCNSPLTLTYAPSALTSTQLGYTITTITVVTSSVSNSWTTIASMVISSGGVWLLQANVGQSANVAVLLSLALSSTVNSYDGPSAQTITPNGSGICSLHTSKVITLTAGATYYMTAYSTSVQTISGHFMSATRIA